MEFAEKVIEKLAGGSALVILPSLSCPSIWLALAELSGQCAFPPGVFNVLYASDADEVAWTSESRS